jgi:hypothetical protein
MDDSGAKNNAIIRRPHGWSIHRATLKLHSIQLQECGAGAREFVYS